MITMAAARVRARDGQSASGNGTGDVRVRVSSRNETGRAGAEMSQRIEEQRQRRRDRKAAKRKLVSEELVRFGESLEGKMVRWTCRSETYVGKVAAFIPANSDATPVVEQEWGFSWESLRRLGTRKLRPVSCHHRLLIRYPRLFVVGQDLIMLPILTAKTMPRFVV